MERQARGGGQTARGAVSVRTAGDGPQEPAEREPEPQLHRRLGRADLRAVPEARRALRELLGRWGRPPGRSDLPDIAELLTSELVTNAIVHTDHDAVLTATVGPRGLRVEVRDFVARRPRVRVPVPDEGTGGRGLLLVQSLADDWGVRPHEVGKSVWFELQARAA
ncbi:ATP-binding protein [Streptomyces sp. AHA2]|uniref:ATP-binding protein n=1 Tax=Streptomyces sp. AHA2 TaxID=3064526 RepID=UPI002FE29574